MGVRQLMVKYIYKYIINAEFKTNKEFLYIKQESQIISNFDKDRKLFIS